MTLRLLGRRKEDGTKKVLPVSLRRLAAEVLDEVAKVGLFFPRIGALIRWHDKNAVSKQGRKSAWTVSHTHIHPPSCLDQDSALWRARVSWHAARRQDA